MAHHQMKRPRIIAHQRPRCRIRSCGRIVVRYAKLCAVCTAEAEYLTQCELEAIGACGRHQARGGTLVY